MAARHAAQPAGAASPCRSAPALVGGRRAARRRHARSATPWLDVLARRLRARHDRAGVLARHARAPGDAGESRAARARAAGRQEPAALRRLHHPRRHRDDVRRHRGVAASSARGAADAQAGRRRCRSARYTLRYDAHRHARRTRTCRDCSPRSTVLRRTAQQIDTLRPEKRFYKKPQAADDRGRDPLDARARTSTWCSGSYDPKTQLATIQAYVNPLVVWIWLGGLILPSARSSRCGRRPRSARCASLAPGAARAAARVTARARGGAACCWRSRWRRAARRAGSRRSSEIEESLTCQCGCGLTVHSCNHLQVSVRRADQEGDRRAPRRAASRRTDPRRVHARGTARRCCRRRPSGASTGSRGSRRSPSC